MALWLDSVGDDDESVSGMARGRRIRSDDDDDDDDDDVDGDDDSVGDDDESGPGWPEGDVSGQTR